MRNILKKVFAAVCLTALMLSLFSCQKSPEETDESTTVYHTVSFNTNGGSAVPSVKIKSGSVATRPEDPVLDNYVFCRWEYNNLPWIFTESSIKEDMTLNAIWVSAEVLFAIDPIDDGLTLKGINRQELFDWLTVPSMINGKNVIAVSDGAFEAVHESYSKHIIFPETVKSIGSESFKNVSTTELTFKGEISSLGESAFERCVVLKEITLGNGLQKIPFRAFAECTSLKHIDIPNGVTVIEEDAFAGCGSMITVVLPASLTSIQDGAFDDCTAMKTVFYMGTEEQFDKIDISPLNDSILDASVYFYSEQKPEVEGNFWHYNNNGSPTIW